jgi:hypothetical protein
MLKLPLALLVLLGTCAAQDAHPLAELQSTARVLMVFAPDTSSVNFKRQLQLIERHSYELTQRNTVVVPVSPSAAGAEVYISGENFPLSTSGDQADARTRYHVKPGEFLVVLIGQNGAEEIRSASPVDIRSLTAKLDSMPRH